jgi:DNA recombination protein RmuC
MSMPFLVLVLVLGLALMGLFFILKTQLKLSLAQLSQDFEKHQQTQQHLLQTQQLQSLAILQENLTLNFSDVREQMQQTLKFHGESVNKEIRFLTEHTKERLENISKMVDKRLNEGFEKTNTTFSDVIKRLALIDAAQQKISELSKDVLSLQSILNDKRSRGAFGEVQLSALIKNLLPETQYQFQYTLSNGKRADCILFLPEPSGNIVIDAKFPLENYERMLDQNLSDNARKEHEKSFKQDIKKHIHDIHEKYIIPGETAEGAILFIPAEAIFAEIHANFRDLVELAQRSQVWMVSPTTMMAVLTTARAVLKDAATRKQVHIIQDHLKALSKDFERFQGRMDTLAKHIQQANKDVDEVNMSARKITSRFGKIEKVDLEALSDEMSLLSKEDELIEAAEEDVV